LHRFDCISNQVDNHLLDLIACREHDEKWLLKMEFNWSKPAVYVFPNEADCVLDEANHIEWSPHDWLSLEQ